MEKITIGIDFGTDSARAVLVGTESGDILFSSQTNYSRWHSGKYCKPEEFDFHHHPLDYIEALEFLLEDISRRFPNVSDIVSICVDTTCSTPCLVGEDWMPLALKPEYSENPGAMFVLWKDKSGFLEADILRDKLVNTSIKYLKHCGNSYSAEYTWSKILHQLKAYDGVRKNAFGYIEAMDFVTGLLLGRLSFDMKASISPAIIKGLWSKEWGGFPTEIFSEIDSDLCRIAKNVRYDYCTPGTYCGKLSKKYCDLYGFSDDVIVGIGAVDSHSAVIGSGAASNELAMSLGTSACFWVNYQDKESLDISPDGLVGDAESIMIDGYRSTGVGLSAFGDVYAWFSNILCWKREKESLNTVMDLLTKEAKKLPVGPCSLISTDHFNGRRSPFVNDSLRSGITGLSLSTTAPEIFKSLVEATAFATKAATDQLIKKGIAINSFLAVGGVSRKSDYVMQILADVLDNPVTVCNSDDSGARGAAILAAAAAKLFSDLPSAQKRMTSGDCIVFSPRSELKDYYQSQYNRYIDFVKFNETI